MKRQKTESGIRLNQAPVTGYVKSEFILTGDAAKQEALNVAELMAIVSTDRLNARTEPSTESPIWTQISNSERYAVLKQMDGWVEIELDSTSAYVATDFVDVRYALNEAIKFSPIVETASSSGGNKGSAGNKGGSGGNKGGVGNTPVMRPVPQREPRLQIMRPSSLAIHMCGAVQALRGEPTVPDSRWLLWLILVSAYRIIPVPRRTVASRSIPHR